MKPIIIKNSTKGYNYDYTDLANLNKTLDSLGISYMQKTETDEKNGCDYVWTKIYYSDSTETDWIRGAKIVNATLQGKSNPAQEYGSALTYARRYSLFTVLGIATTDDDAECLTVKKETTKESVAKAIEENAGNQKSTLAQQQLIQDLIQKNNITPEESKLDMANFGNKKFRDLTKIEADSYIKVLNQYDKVRAKREAQNGQSN